MKNDNKLYDLYNAINSYTIVIVLQSSPFNFPPPKKQFPKIFLIHPSQPQKNIIKVANSKNAKKRYK